MRTIRFYPFARTMAFAISAQLIGTAASRCDIADQVVVIVPEAEVASLKGWKRDCPRSAFRWCLLHGIVLALVGIESIEVGWLHDSSNSEMVGRDVVARRNARGLDTASCSDATSSTALHRWSKDFVSDFIVDPHPLCLPDPDSKQRLTFMQEGFEHGELRDAMSQIEWDHFLIGGGWRQPSGVRSLFPDAPAFDMIPSKQSDRVSLKKDDMTDRIVGVIYNHEAPILQEGDVWLYRDHEMSVRFGGSDLSLFSGMVDMESLSFVDIANPFSQSGILTSWRWVGYAGSPVHLKIYRPIDTFVFELVGTSYSPSSEIGIVNHLEVAGDNIIIKKGDVIGWTFEGSPSFGFRQATFGKVALCPDVADGGQYIVGGKAVCSENAPRIYDIMAIAVTDRSHSSVAGDRRLASLKARTATNFQHDDLHNFRAADLAHTFDVDGFITGWAWLGYVASPVYLQIYRPMDGAAYALVGETYVENAVVGAINQVYLDLADQIAVRKGDVIGWTFVGEAAFGFRKSESGNICLLDGSQETEGYFCFHHVPRVYDIVASFGQVRIAGMPPLVIKGRSFLEVAAVDGRNCFHAERLGATDVLCIDYHLWGGREDEDTEINYGSFATFAQAFKLEHCLRQSKVRAMRINVYDLSPSLLGGKFDVVRAFGLAYHLKHPLLGIEALSSVTREALIIETETLGIEMPVPENYPKRDLALCQWIRAGELSNDTTKVWTTDDTNFWVCNTATWLSWLRSSGFVAIGEIARLPGVSPYTLRSTFVALKPGASVSIDRFL